MRGKSIGGRMMAAAVLVGVGVGAFSAQAAEKAGSLPVDLLASADPAAGAKVAERCVRCHSLEQGGAAKFGPTLYGIVGAPRARTPDYVYSQAMKDLGGTWTIQELQAFVANPDAYLPGGKMSIFVGVKDPKDRADLLAYLNRRSDAPLDLATAP